jgi:hypothetical protein
MSDFDPDAYLAKKTAAAAPGFDPDAYLAKKMKPQVGVGETFINQAVNWLPGGRPLVDWSASGVLRQAKAARALGEQMGLLNPGVQITPQARAEMQAKGIEIPEAPTEPGILDLEAYRNIRDTRAARTEAGYEQNPWSGRAGTATGIGLTMLAPFLPKSKAAAKSGLLGVTKAGAKTGALYGALSGATQGPSDLTRGDILGTIGDVLGGGLVGGALGAGLVPAVSGVGKLLRSAIRGVIKPTAPAQYLRSKGVPLTAGQMNPNSALAQIEEASTSVGGIGPSIKAQRDAAVAAWQNAVINQARPPGMAPLNAAQPISERLAQSYGAFEPAYAPAKAAMVSPTAPGGIPFQGTPAPAAPPPSALLDAFGRAAPQSPAPARVVGAFEKVVKDPSVLATDETRGVVRAFLNDQASILGQKGSVPAQTLLTMRSNVRSAVADALRAQDFPKAQLLQRAEEQITGSLETQLPTEALTALRAADAQYAQHKILTDAIRAAGDKPGGFTPAQLSQAVRGSTEAGAYARGGGGELRDLASAGREVLDARVPMTGARLLVSGPLKWVTAPGAYAANLPTIQRALLGEYPVQKSLQSALNTLNPISEALRGSVNQLPYFIPGRSFRPPLQPAPVASTDKEREQRKARRGKRP